MNRLEVAELVGRARDGDQDAWNEIVERYATLVWAVCQRYRLTGGDAEDVAASVWLRLVERLDTIREPAALAGWIATTTRRECVQAIRQQRRQVPVEETWFLDEPDGTASDEWLLGQERHVALRLAFAQLPERCRRLLAMLFGDQSQPYSAVARSLGTTVGSVGPTRVRCLDRLRASPDVAALMDAQPSKGR